MIRLAYSFVLLSCVLALGACQVEPPSKDDVRGQPSGKSDGIDWCAELDWYGDGECDDFCAEPDPDCGGGEDAGFCADGTVVAGPGRFEPSSDDMECARPDTHCVTADPDACPMLAPLPPSFCPDGRIVSQPRFIPSADGMECALPAIHCLTNDLSRCPMRMPLPPGFCADGNVVVGEPTYVDSADGMECELPSVHCVSADPDACPVF